MSVVFHLQDGAIEVLLLVHVIAVLAEDLHDSGEVVGGGVGQLDRHLVHVLLKEIFQLRTRKREGRTYNYISIEIMSNAFFGRSLFSALMIR